MGKDKDNEEYGLGLTGKKMSEIPIYELYGFNTPEEYEQWLFFQRYRNDEEYQIFEDGCQD